MSTATTGQVLPPDAASGLASPFPATGVIRESLAELRASWGWLVTLGTALMILGLAAMSYATLATLATALAFGYFMLAAGVVYIVGAFFTRGWGGFFLSLLAGVLHLHGCPEGGSIAFRAVRTNVARGRL